MTSIEKLGFLAIGVYTSFIGNVAHSVSPITTLMRSARRIITGQGYCHLKLTFFDFIPNFIFSMLFASTTVHSIKRFTEQNPELSR